MDHAATTGRDSAKQRSRRIPLDYHRQQTPLDRGKWLLTALAALAAGVYVVCLLIGWGLEWPSAQRQFSPAPVASVHAAWDTQCAACHVAGENLRSDGQAASLLAGLFASGDQSRENAADARCAACHAGPAHHDNQLAAEVVSCAACHRDHQGRDGDLLRMADQLCTSCHRDIQEHRDPARPSAVGDRPIVNVADWASHPEFRSLGGDQPESFTDPSRLKFNHALHMLPGQAPPDAKETAQKKWRSIDAADREGLLAGADAPGDDEVVQLACASCHQLEPAADSQGLPAQGAYMQPIRFEQHCAACHRGELKFSTPDASEQSSGEVPHGLNAAAMRQMVLGALAPAPQLQRLTPQHPRRPIPGRTAGDNLAQNLDRGMAQRLQEAEAELAREHRCGKCHHLQSTGVGGLMPEIESTSIPSVWLKHARFDHAAHRGMTCFECHDEKFFTAAAGKPPLDPPLPMISGRATCARCHAPVTVQGTPGARYDCVECHRYHGSDLPPHGRGETERGVPEDRRQGLERFLSGSVRSASSTPTATRKSP